GRRALLGDEVGRRTVAADRLSLALLEAQQVDDRPAEQEDKDECGDDGALSSAVCLGNCFSNALTIGPIFEPRDPFTITASPAPMAPSTAGSSAAAVSAYPPRAREGRASHKWCISGPEQKTRSMPVSAITFASERCNSPPCGPSSSISPRTAMRRPCCPIAASASSAIAARMDAGLAL